MIYCVEDEGAIRDLMIYTLRASGFEAQGFENSIGFWSAMKAQKPELIILDVMLPGEDGLTILKRLRVSPVTADIPEEKEIFSSVFWGGTFFFINRYIPPQITNTNHE